MYDQILVKFCEKYRTVFRWWWLFFASGCPVVLSPFIEKTILSPLGCFCSSNFPLLWYLGLCVCVLSHFSHVWLFATLWTVARQAPLPMGFFRQECWSGLPFPSPGALPDPGIKLMSPAAPSLHMDSLPLSHPGSPVSGFDIWVMLA